MSATELKHREETTLQTELKQQRVDCIRMLEQSDILDYNGHAPSTSRVAGVKTNK